MNSKIHLIALRVASIYHFSDDRSLAKTIREKLWDEIITLMPNVFDLEVGPSGDGLYDTHSEGKGFKAGFVSFAVKPKIWTKNRITGGVLLNFNYSPEKIRSTSPAEGSSERITWTESGGNPNLVGVKEVGDLSAGYYNKSLDGGSRMELINDAEFELDKHENVVNWSWSDPKSVIDKITGVINDVIANPPEGSLSTETLHRINPYTSVTKFVRFLRMTNREEYYRNEVLMVAKAMGSVPHKVMEKIPSVFRYIPTDAPPSVVNTMPSESSRKFSFYL